MAEMKFEEALKKLEKIVADLENGDLPLDEALGRYEEGIRLSKACAKKLETARKKVEVLLKAEDGSLELKDFEEKSADADQRPQGAKRKRVKAGEDLL